MKITLIPTGGLCNRLRAIATGVAVADKYNAEIIVCWNNSRGAKANFSDLFQPINKVNVRLNENKKPIFKVTSERSYYLRSLFFKLLFDKVIYNYSFNRTSQDITLEENNKLPQNLLLISCYPLCAKYSLKDLFVPTQEIEEAICSITKRFNHNTIGVHIRRTDNVVSINDSPLEVFIEKMNEEIEKNPNVLFYLASDDYGVKELMSKTFSGRVISINEILNRNSTSGMKFAVIELFCLSRTNKIIGSYNSSYSEMAALLGDVPLQFAIKR